MRSEEESLADYIYVADFMQAVPQTARAFGESPLSGSGEALPAHVAANKLNLGLLLDKLSFVMAGGLR